MSEPKKEPREDELFQAARDGDTQALKMLLDRHPEKRDLRQAPYEWSLLHVAAHTLDANLSVPTVIHFIACVICFYLGLFSLRWNNRPASNWKREKGRSRFT